MALTDNPPTLDEGDPLYLFAEYTRTLVGPWQTPALLNGWLPYDETRWNTAQYRYFMGDVQLRGMITGGTARTVMFELPGAFTPGKYQYLPGVDFDGDHVGVDVLSSGSVRAKFSAGNEIVSLSGLMFSLDS